VAGFTVAVKGLREVVRSFDQYAGAVDDLKEANAKIGSVVAQTAKATAPYDTGALQGSIRFNRAKQKIQLKAGGARVPYAGVIEYGWPARNISPQPFLRRAAWDKRDFVKEQYSANLRELSRRYIGGSK
jgi:hypothetical protein